MPNIRKNKKIFVQFIAYIFVGGVAFMVDFSALWFFTEIMRIHYLYSAAIGFIFGLSMNYLLSIHWVFNVRRLNSARIEFMIFTIIGIVGLMMNELVLWFFTDMRSVYYLYSKIIATGVVFVWNFAVRKVVLF